MSFDGRGMTCDIATLRVEIREELNKGRIVETSLREDGYVLDGLCDHGNQTVYIDPAPSIVETLIHELIHRRWPSWSETRVRIESQRLLGDMTPDEVRKWYRDYLKLRKIRRTPIKNDSEP